MVVFGGRSGEHEVSLASARAIMEALGGRHEVGSERLSEAALAPRQLYRQDVDPPRKAAPPRPKY